MPIKTLFQKANIEINAAQEETFQKLLTAFRIENEKINLSSFNDEKNIIIKHFIDSLLPHESPIFAKSRNLADIGTGSGFPGLALAVLFPHIECTLIDSVQKKVHAIERMKECAGLKNVKTVAGRIEVIAHEPSFRESFDIVAERALAPVATMLEYCLPLAKKNGYVIAYQTRDAEMEFQNKSSAMKLLGGKIEHVENFFLPENSGERKIFYIKKIFSSPSKFPRRIGEPLKNPLK